MIIGLPTGPCDMVTAGVFMNAQKELCHTLMDYV